MQNQKNLYTLTCIQVYLNSESGIMTSNSNNLYPEKWLHKAATGERIACELRMRVIAGLLKQGTVLSENKLAADFDVSRSPIRDALKILAAENMVRLDRMGAIVNGLSEKKIAEMYDVRLLIESFVFERLATSENDKLVRELQKITEMMKIAVHYSDADEFALQDISFHETIIHAIDHSYISMIWNNLRPVMEGLILLSMRHRFQENKQDFVRVIDNHILYIQAIDQKDHKLMHQSLHQNFDDVQQTVDDFWKAHQTFQKGDAVDE